MESRKYSINTKNAKRKEFFQTESQKVRLRRRKMKESNFETIKVIGRGGYGEVKKKKKFQKKKKKKKLKKILKKVRLVKLKETNEFYAMKVMKKSRLIKKKQENHVFSERNALASLTIDPVMNQENQWVTKLHYSFQDEKQLYLVMDFIGGGDLMHKLFELDIFSIEQCRFYIAEIVLAIDSIHMQNWVHRDIKPDNILLDLSGHIKLTDFGFSTGIVHENRWHQLSLNDSSRPHSPSLPPFHNPNQRFSSWKKNRKFMVFHLFLPPLSVLAPFPPLPFSHSISSFLFLPFSHSLFPISHFPPSFSSIRPPLSVFFPLPHFLSIFPFLSSLFSCPSFLSLPFFPLIPLSFTFTFLCPLSSSLLFTFPPFSPQSMHDPTLDRKSIRLNS